MNSVDALNTLQNTENNAQNPQDIYNQQQQQYGVNQAQQTVQGLRGAINNTTQLLQKVAPSVMGRTAQSLVTSAQANRQIQNESAPIQQTLSGEGTQYNQASQDYQDLEGKASDAAKLAYQGQQDKISYLQNLYNSLYGQEKDAKDQAEQVREFNESLKAKAASSGGSGGSSSSKGNQAYAQQRAGGGFNFQKADGGTISARRYAQIKGIDFNQLLRSMAASGDSGAADVLKNGASSKAYKALTYD